MQDKSYVSGGRYHETYRNQFHYSPCKNWINDPNGLVYYHGEYHLFYQYTPNSVHNGSMCWGHAISTDLVHWEELNVALWNDEHGDIFSGSCVIDEHNTSGLFNGKNGGLVALYTIADGAIQQQAVAYSSDDGRTWIKFNDGLPVITIDQDPTNNRDFRDPKVFRADDNSCWLMLVGGGPLRIYSSLNLIDWELESVYNETQRVGYQEADSSSDPYVVYKIYTECPDVFKLEIDHTQTYKWILSECGVYYIIGDVKKVDEHWYFIPDELAEQQMSFGPDAYAAQTFYHTGKRTILMNWMNNWKSSTQTANWTRTFNGSMTFPTELSLHNTSQGLRLCQKPVREISSLYTEDTAHYEGGSGKDLLHGFTAEMYRLDIEIENCYDTELTVSMFSGDVELKFGGKKGKLLVDRRKTGLGGGYLVDCIPDDDLFRLTVLVDTASIEVYADDGIQTGSFNVFGTQERGLNIIYRGTGHITVDAVALDSIWK